jgi:peptidyl-prolyl cis-trans isomerase C
MSVCLRSILSTLFAIRARILGIAAATLLVGMAVQPALTGSPALAQTAPVAAQATKPPAALGDQPAGSLANLADQLDKSPDTVVADVNGTPVTLGMVADRLRDFAPNLAALPAKMVYKAAVEDIVQQRAMAIKARELGVDKNPATQRRIALATDHELALAMVNRILPEMVTDKAIEDLYNKTIAGKPGPEEVKLRVIATTTEADARQVLNALAEGTDFATVAKQSSRDPSRLAGGEVGYTTREHLTPEIGAIAFALSPGQISMFPILSRGLWFIIKVEERRQLGTPSLADSKAALTQTLIHEAATIIRAKSRAAVIVNEYGPTGMDGKTGDAAAKTK